MKIHPPPEQFAKEIMAFLVRQQKMQAGDIIPASDALSLWQQNQRRSSDFRTGMDFAIDDGWVELQQQESGNHFRLTEKGFASA